MTSPFFFAVILIIAACVVAAGLAVLATRGRQPRALPGEVPQRRDLWVSGLAKTRSSFVERVLATWRGPSDADAALAELEEVLLTSDVGVRATAELIAQLRARAGELQTPQAFRDALQAAIRSILVGDGDAHPPVHSSVPAVILVVGVNGVGKTTTIGKLAHLHRSAGRKVLLVAADTFRAAAIEQLSLWAERTGSDIVKHQHGADPAAVVFDGLKAAQARGADVVIIDTAGRLHVKTNLMEELKKVVRTIQRQIAEAPHETLLVVDATTGQNALNQARVFHEAIKLDGVVLAKLDGTARGGIALAIRKQTGVPIRYVGLGERPEDLALFDVDAFVAGLFNESRA